MGYNNQGTVSNSYATGSVTGDSGIGGLVGFNRDGDISNSYATGAVTGTGRWVGGLVGYSSGGTISDSYATGLVTGGRFVGGLVGSKFESTITASYYNSETTGQDDTGKGEPKTTAELVAPTGSTGIYVTWNSAGYWDFGTNGQYPVLKIDVDGSGSVDAADLAIQRPARLSVNLTNLDFVAGGEEKDFIITSNVTWTAAVSTGDSWLTLDMTSGTNNATVSATAVQNVVPPRMATITLTAGTLVWIITVTQATLTVPDAPTNLTATAVSDTQIDLSWDAPSEDGGEAVTGYDLEYSEDGNEPWTDLTTSGTTTSFDDTGLTVGSTRHYRVAAINAVGTGAYSATASSPVLLSVPLEVEDGPGVYPNPGSDKVYVNLPNGNGAYVVRLHTLTGKVVLQKQLQGGGTRTLSLSKLQDGLYILNVQKDGQSSSYRLIKATH